MSEPNNETILAQTSPRIKRSVLPTSVPEEDSNGYGIGYTHNWMKEENQNLTVSYYYKSDPKQREFMRRVEMLWQVKHPTATLDIKQLNNLQYRIMKKHLPSDLELKELRSGEIG